MAEVFADCRNKCPNGQTYEDTVKGEKQCGEPTWRCLFDNQANWQQWYARCSGGDYFCYSEFLSCGCPN